MGVPEAGGEAAGASALARRRKRRTFIRLISVMKFASRLPHNSWFLVALGLALGCSATSSEVDGLSGGSGGSGAGGSQSQGAQSVAFEDDDPTLMMVPGEDRTLKVRVSPPGVYVVRFALLGDSKNAALDRSEATTDEQGVGEIELVAPTEPTTFSLRASVGTAVTDQKAVSVSASGFGTVQIVPRYQGERPISFWVGSVVTGTKCADLPGTPPPDGPLANTSLAEQAPRVEGVPVGPVLAVTLRAGHYAGGCTDVESIDADQLNEVLVSVVDRPMQLDETDLAIDLGVDTTAPEWSSTVEAAIDALTTEMLGAGENDAAALLDAMNLATLDAADEVAFAAARSTGLWDDALVGQMGSASSLSSAVREWIRSGMETFESVTTFSGSLESAGASGGQAILHLDTVAGIDAATAGFAESNGDMSWSADPGDTVHLGGKLFWFPSKLLTAVAVGPAGDVVAGAVTVPEALSAIVDCGSVGTALVASGQAPGVAFGACDASCVEQLCDAALVTMWQRAEQASASSASIATLSVTAAGDATVDDEARPRAFDGSWVGTVDVGFAQLSIGGPAKAETPAPK